MTSLGPLSAFTGTFTGTGLNAIFRPQNPATPTTPFPESNNVLELNLTSETLTFTTDIGPTCNRGSLQGDIALDGVSYLQKISDVTDPDNIVAIHYEPGVWMVIPATQSPAGGPSVVRMGSIPHGTTINAQGTYSTIQGPPTIPPMNTADTTPPNGINPFVRTMGVSLVNTPSLTAANKETARIPQDLSRLIAAGSITQEILDDPNTLLRNAIKGKNILSTTIISVSTESPASIPFLGKNALPIQMRSTFYIETVHATVFGIFSRTFTQIQYTQEVLLAYGGIIFPHVTVGTLT